MSICGNVVEDPGLMEPAKGYQKTFFDLCKYMRITEVVKHLGVDWKIDKESYPHIAIMFDQFHVIRAFSKVIQKIHNMIYMERRTKSGKRL
jgi:hypothetical protein